VGDIKENSNSDNKEQRILNMNLSSATSGGSGIDFYIEKFPKEFKKGFFTGFDKVFYAILLLSFILNITAILVLEKFSSTEISEKTISKIQQQYAQLLLENNFAGTAPLTSGEAESGVEKDVEVITGLSDYMNSFTPDVLNLLNNFSPKDLPLSNASTAGGANGLSREQMADMRQASAERRFAGRSNLSRNVENVGLLGLISSTSRTVDKEYVQDLLEYANQNSQQLQTVLTKLDRIKKPHYGSSLYQQKMALGSKRTDYKQSLKGYRKTADAEVDALVREMAPLQKAKREVVARNTRYEKVPSSSMASVSKAKTLRRRDAKSVVATIRSHFRSLQDCYKRELREIPSLKGKVSVRFTVNPDGAVIAVELISSTLNNSRLESCLLAKIRRWRDFPPCDASFGNQTFRQTFKFGM